MFEQASRLKVRFESEAGNISVEDLWDVPLTSNGVSLDKIARSLNRQLKESEEQSFVQPTTQDSLTQLKFEIVKHIINVKIQEKETAQQTAEVKIRKERLLAILANKQDAELQSKSSEEIEQLIKDL